MMAATKIKNLDVIVLVLITLQGVHSEGFLTEAPGVELEPFLTTSTFRYSISTVPSDVHTAQKICHSQGGNLLSVQTPSELETLSANLNAHKGELLWTSAIRFSNDTVENLLVWSGSSQPFVFPLDFDIPENLRLARASRKKRTMSIRNRRSAPTKEMCKCPCPTTRPTLPPPCKPKECTGYRPGCKELGNRTCIIARPPICEALEKNCTVSCDKDCIIIAQPECKVISKPICKLLAPSVPCHTKAPPICEIVNPGTCHTNEVNCTLKVQSCTPIIKPCKNPCTKPECTSVTTPCPCHNEKTCPPEACPPPRTVCTKAFVDCSPEICQSNVLICPSAKLICPPSPIICTQPEVKCNDPDIDCPEPEVICGEPEIQCTKAKVKCPDATVNCDPIIAQCEAPSFLCTDPVMDTDKCQLVKNCDESGTTCPVPTITPAPIDGDCGNYCPCADSKTRGDRVAREVSSELEYVEKTECIAMSASKNKWVAKSCNLKHKFICQM